MGSLANMGLELREAKEEDVDYLMHCMAEGILNSVTDEEREMKELWIPDIIEVSRNALSADIDKKSAFVLMKNDERCGMLWLDVSRDQFTCDETGYLMGIYVARDLRKQGIGKYLIREAESWCKRKGLLSLTLNVGVGNVAARRLYVACGLEPQTNVMRKRLV